MTHHAGVTFVQSLTQNIAVGSTLKVVRGIAATRIGEPSSAEEALDADDPEGRGTTRVDLDFGVMVTGGKLKAGLTSEIFASQSSRPRRATLTLERQARAGASYRLLLGLVLASDFDLLKGSDAFGERLDAARGSRGARASAAGCGPVSDSTCSTMTAASATAGRLPRGRPSR